MNNNFKTIKVIGTVTADASSSQAALDQVNFKFINTQFEYDLNISLTDNLSKLLRLHKIEEEIKTFKVSFDTKKHKFEFSETDIEAHLNEIHRDFIRYGALLSFKVMTSQPGPSASRFIEIKDEESDCV